MQHTVRSLNDNFLVFLTVQISDLLVNMRFVIEGRLTLMYNRALAFVTIRGNNV